MDYTMLITENKSLITTVPRTIYQGEKSCDSLRIFCPMFLSDYLPVAMAILPNNTTGKISAIEFEEENYKDYRVIKIPLTNDMTNNHGHIKFWIMFFGIESDYIYKTGVNNIPVYKHLSCEISNDSDIPSSDSSSIFAVITELQASVAKLEKTKADSVYIDDETNELVLTSKGSKLESVQLPEGIDWTGWE